MTEAERKAWWTLTEAEWTGCTDPQRMLQFLKGKASDRKLRLFACACCRTIWTSLTYGRSKQVVEVAEKYADGLATEAELQKAYSNAREAAYRMTAKVTRGSLANRNGWTLDEARHYFASEARHIHKPFLFRRLGQFFRDDDLRSISPALLRDIVSNPFKPVTLNTTWLTTTVQQLASAIYEDRAFDRMPILGDALEDAGCDNTAILEHCRGGGEHVRGCWALDLVLGKE